MSVMPPLEHAVSENVYAGTAMNRRAIFMYGSALPKSATAPLADVGHPRAHRVPLPAA
ncbi:hypothetical protein [Actinoallomurus iriomotensis]|uniref:Uncharacterized protein n=1 Tax=Actinoallomurus iriomotensis TaxID=478107 RepID=A0A9W6RMF5_9ACTN|nr:hypothetical protein [Actinoallomurus iriomotensis]GLY76697.1 hypothetical protein Airi01_049640 [Actinoallomurus iriomotensis]